MNTHSSSTTHESEHDASVRNGQSLDHPDSLLSPSEPASETSNFSPALVLRKVPIHRPVVMGLLGAGILVVGGLGVHWWQYTTTHESTNDANVTANIHPINARVSGTVKAVLVNDNQYVKQGEELVKLDPRDYQVALQQAQASLANAQQQALVAQANIGVVATNAEGQTTQAQGDIDAANAAIATAQAQVLEAQAGVPSAQANLAEIQANLVKAQDDYQRYQTLARQGAVPEQQFDSAQALYNATLAEQDAAKDQVQQAQARVQQAQQNLADARAKLSSTRGGLEQAQATNQQTEAERRQYQAALAAVAEADAEVQKAQLQLSYTDITAPDSGQIGDKTVQVGQQVQPGQTLMALIQKRPWIVANFKETQLEDIKPGQEVDISLDAFPHHTFKGRVESLSPASGSEFSLLPPDNATGNFTKIVQRIPVKIVFDADSIQEYESRITPGMSATVAVNTD